MDWQRLGFGLHRLNQQRYCPKYLCHHPINDAQAAHQALLQLAKSANSNTPSNSGNTQSKLLLLDKYPQLPINAQPLISQLYGQQIGLWFSQAQAAILPNCIVITTHANHLLVVTSSILQGQTLGIQTNFRNFFTQLNVNTTQFFMCKHHNYTLG